MRKDAWGRGSFLVVLLAVTAVLCGVRGVEAAGPGKERLFPFQLPWDDASPSVTDLSGMNVKPAGRDGRLTAGTDGHIYSGKNRVRFLGVNLTHRSAMPAKDVAEKIAGRLAKFGVNVVRFHLMDAGWGSGGIIDASKPGTRHLDPAAVDRLDYFISKLKERGIYSNLNLLTGRDFKAADGLPAAIDSVDWKDKQTPATFDPAMIALQKEYASQLLNRVNPYTGESYLTDPAIGFIEMVNEHGLIHAWHGGSVDRLPPTVAEPLRVQWNEYLKAHFQDQESLEEAWTLATPPGDQLLKNRDFAAGLGGWNVEQHESARVTASVTREGPSGKPSAKLQVTQVSGQNWHVQLNQGNLPIEQGKVYTLSFWAKADRAKTINVTIEQAHDPWWGLGFANDLALTSSWRKFEFVLAPSGSDNNARLNFRNMADIRATYWFADLSLTVGGTIGVFSDEKLSSGTFRLVRKDGSDRRTDRVRDDWLRFLWESERDYWTEMRDFLRETLGSKSLLVGTIVGTSTPNLMNLFDVVDSHAYWQHPSFEVSWGSPWWIRNSSMVGEEDGGTVTGLAMKRVEGKPFSVSEYGHPYPNSFSSEALYFLSIFGALQDWDALYAYTYADGTLNWLEDKQNGYFDIQHDPGKISSLVQAAHIFRRGDVQSAKQLVLASLSSEEEIELLPSAGAWRLLDGEHVGLPRLASIVHRVSIAADSSPHPPGAIKPEELVIEEGPEFVSDTGELTWNPERRVLSLVSPQTRGFIGYGTGEEFDLGGVKIRPLSSIMDWMSVFLSELGDSTVEARHYLISAHGIVQNTDTDYRLYPSNQVTGFPPPADVNITLGGWGRSPVQAEGVRCELQLPYPASRVRVFALDSQGARGTEVPVSGDEGSARFQVGEQYKTLWYEVVIEPEISTWYLPALPYGAGEFLGIAVSNPSGNSARVRIEALGNSPSYGSFSLPSTEFVVGPSQQVARLAHELLGVPDRLPVAAWFRITSDAPDVGVFAQRGDSKLTSLDGAMAFNRTEKRLIVPRIQSGAKAFRGADSRAMISIANPSSLPARVRLRHIVNGGAGGGEVAGEVTDDVDPEAYFLAPIEELFGNPVLSGYLSVEVIEGEGVVAAVLVEVPEFDSSFILNGQPAGFRPSLYSAQWAHLQGLFYTSLKLVNHSEESRTVRLYSILDSGEMSAAPAEFVMAPSSELETELSALLSATAANGASPAAVADFVGSLRVDVQEGGGVIGDVVFGLENHAYAAALPLQGVAFRKAVFSHLANLPGLFYTGLALMNPGSSTTAVELTTFSTNGFATAKKVLDLAAGGRVSTTLTQLLPETGSQVGGYLVLESDQPLIAQQLFGTTGLSMLSAIPPAGLR